MDDVPPRSYGPLIEATMRIVTWNVWGLYGPWQEREAAIIATLQDADPDVVVLVESWAKGEDSQCRHLVDPLDLPYHAYSGVPAQEDEAALSGIAVLSRWPKSRARQDAVRELLTHVARGAGRAHPTHRLRRLQRRPRQ